MSTTPLIEALERQEQALVFDVFNEETAYEVGCALRELAASRQAPVVIDIRTSDRRFFFAALPGSAPTNDHWARRKGNMTLRMHCSSWLAAERMEAAGEPPGPDFGLDPLEFAAHGGGFPVRLRNVGVVGVVAAISVSGLPSRDDHGLIVIALSRHLGVDNIDLDTLFEGSN